MAQTPAEFVCDGRTIDYTPVSAVAAGDVVVQGKLVGVAKVPIAAAALGALAVTGVFDAPKDSSNVTAAGAALYWDADGNPVGGTAGTGAMTTTATGNTFAGWSLEVAGTTVGTVRMLLRSVNDTTSIGLDNLSDVGTVAHTAGRIIVADGTKYEEVAVSGPFNLSAAGNIAVDSATVAATGSTQADAAALADGFSLVSAGDGTKGVKLPTAAAGGLCIVKNGANAVLKVWPNTSDAINALSANAALSMAAYTSAVFTAYDATTWYTVPLVPS